MTDISAVPGLTEVDLSVSGPDELERATLALSRHGLVVARNAVRPGTIRAFRAQLCERMTQAEGAPVSWGGLRRGVSQERVLLMRRAAYDCPHLATLFRSPRLLDLMGHVLDTYEPFLHPRKWMRSSRARGDETGAQPMHQDHWFVGGTPDVYTVWIPLHDCAEGGIGLVPGSHLRGRREADELDPRKGAVDRAGLGGVVVPRCGLGDVVVFHSLTVHGTVLNPAPLHRLSVDGRFQSPAEPIAADQLFPAIAAEDGEPIARSGAVGEGMADWCGDPAFTVHDGMRVVAAARR